jgi:hypothetical protein
MLVLACMQHNPQPRLFVRDGCDNTFVQLQAK